MNSVRPAQKRLQWLITAVQIVLALWIIQHQSLQFVKICFWAKEIIGKRITSNQDAWERTTYGELAAFSTFLLRNGFLCDDPHKTVIVPDRRKTKAPFINKIRLKMLPLYLFPARFEASSDYPYRLSAKTAKELKKSGVISESFKNLRFYLVKDALNENNKTWRLHIYPAPGRVDVFMLPEDYIENLK